ncbi:MAG: SAM-dependent methyltransferase [Defluviitaleaceae bacterium]|nr:SAM-dependent methyltransferase [Defluviitaleaceae bacterium]MCL2273559.1 SAM-dependent methyltransferase [Defluviitaleaceae bacterium]
MKTPLFSTDTHKITVSGAVKGAKYTRGEILRTPTGYQAALYTAKQVFHENISPSALHGYVENLLSSTFTHCNAWDGTFRYAVRVTKKGKILTSRTADTTPPKEDKEKNHLIREGMNIPILTDIGVFTQENKIVNAKRDKFIQINRFLELIADETRSLAPSALLNIIDIGCGKSYLTFLVYHYFTQIRGMSVNMLGIDTNEELINKCTLSAKKYNYTTLTFMTGDVKDQKNPPLESWGKENACNIIISLHACDTATDHALYNAVQWNADLIYAVPCCQHELRSQMQGGDLPLFSRYGIIQERTAALATDAIRAALLESVGYKVQIIELTDRENTAKNLMLRANKVQRTNNIAHEKAVHREVEQMCTAFGFKPALLGLLQPSPLNTQSHQTSL